MCLFTGACGYDSANGSLHLWDLTMCGLEGGMGGPPVARNCQRVLRCVGGLCALEAKGNTCCVSSAQQKGHMLQVCPFEVKLYRFVCIMCKGLPVERAFPLIHTNIIHRWFVSYQSRLVNNNRPYWAGGSGKMCGSCCTWTVNQCAAAAFAMSSWLASHQRNTQQNIRQRGFSAKLGLAAHSYGPCLRSCPLWPRSSTGTMTSSKQRFNIISKTVTASFERMLTVEATSSHSTLIEAAFHECFEQRKQRKQLHKEQ